MDRKSTETIKAHRHAFRAAGVTGVFAFGSRARGDHRPDSDLDLFIDYDPKERVPSLFELVGLELNLGDQLGFPVYITTRSSLHPLMKDQILRDAIRLI
jgi:predicted nucleotidyltransferase